MSTSEADFEDATIEENNNRSHRKTANEFDLLKNIKLKFRWLPKNFLVDQQNQSLCLFDNLHDVLYGKQKPILEKRRK